MSAADKIARKLNFMQRYVGYLRSVQDTDKKTLEEDYGLRSSIERNFHLAIESAIDIGEIIISEEGFNRPEDYRSVFLILGRQGILPGDFTESFSLAAGFRNILVHAYEEVDPDIVYDFLTEKLGDFDDFARHIARYLEKKTQEKK
ncbi:MAG: DUF86 domain-containing protein [Candidatus Hydrothermarchaeales archaeon]